MGAKTTSRRCREIAEELGCGVLAGSIRSLGEFDAVAANEPGFRVQASLYGIDVTGEIAPRREIDETIWIDPAAPPDIVLAPLTRDHVLPLASTRPVTKTPFQAAVNLLFICTNVPDFGCNR